MTTPGRRLVLKLAQGVVSVGLLGYVTTLLDWTQVQRLWADGRLMALWPGPLCLLVGVVAAASRWRLLLQAQQVDLARSDALVMYLRATFYGVFLPGVLGGDVVRATLCKLKTGAEMIRIASSIALERLAGMWCLALIGAAGVCLLSAQWRGQVPWPALFAAPVLALSMPLLFWSAPWLRRQSERLPVPTVLSRALGLVYRFFFPAQGVSRGLMIKVLAAGVLFQGSELVVFAYFSHVLGAEVPWSYWLFVVPLVYLLTVLPVSLGGLGVREGALVWLLGLAGVSASVAALLAFLVYFNRVVLASTGALVNFWPNQSAGIERRRA